MQPLALLFIITSAICLAFLFWLNTKSGKRWKDNL